MDFLSVRLASIIALSIMGAILLLAAAVFMMQWRNRFAKAVFERAVMTPLTLVLALLALRFVLVKVAGNG